MSDIDLDSALSQFYEDESLTDALTDQPADALLKWGEAQVQFLAQQAKDEDEFDHQFTALRKLIRNLSRYVAEHQEMAQDEQQESLGKISEFAQAIGLTINKTVDSIIEEQKLLSNTDSVAHFLAQFAQSVNQVTTGHISPSPSPAPEHTEEAPIESPVDDITEILPKGALMDFVNKITGAIADAKEQLEQQASSEDDSTTPDDDSNF